MSPAEGRDQARSIHQRLKNLARETEADFNALLAQYAIERALYRLSISDHRDRFVLKGALLFRVWFGELHRPTLDVDLLGRGDPDPAAVEQVVREFLDTPPPDDGIQFDLSTVRAEPIRGGQEYPGVRVRCTARLGAARIPVQLDIGFGDVVVPPATRTTVPTLLDQEVPEVEAYSPESLVAEKLHALVTLGIANSRMKDLFDMLEVSRRFQIEGEVLVEAIRATFERRGTPIPESPPVGLTARFSGDRDKRRQWAAFVGRIGAESTENLDEVVAALGRFLLGPLAAVRDGSGFTKAWNDERWT